MRARAAAVGCALTLAALTASCSLLFGVSDDAASGRRDASLGDGPMSGEGGVNDGGNGDADACTARIDIDPQNCGACGHDCQDAACKDGICIATTVVKSPGTTEIALATNYIYFVDNNGTFGPSTNGIGFCPRGGCEAVYANYIAIAQTLVRSLATSEHSVYWASSSSGELFQHAHIDVIDGGPGFVVPTGIPGIVRVRVVSPSARLLFADSSDAGAIRMCSATDIRDCDASAVVASQKTTAIEDLVVDANGERAYWIARDDGGAIYSCRIEANCTPELVARDEGSAHALAVDATHVYWTIAKANGSVRRAPKGGLAAGEAPETLARDLATPWSIAVDDANVYYSTIADGDAGAGEIARVPKTGGPPFKLATALSVPWQIVTDDTFVYWTNRGYYPAEGSVARVAK